MEKEELFSNEDSRDANINLVLTSYEDIFSDFDPRSYSQRALSDDFLLECRRNIINKNETGAQLILSVPKEKRDTNEEAKIKKRLKEHFHKHYLEKNNVLNKLKKQGWTWIGFGSILMVGAVVLENMNDANLITKSILVLIEAPGWYCFWEGLAKLFVQSEEKEKDFKFYKKMYESDIIFTGY